MQMGWATQAHPRCNRAVLRRFQSVRKRLTHPRHHAVELPLVGQTDRDRAPPHRIERPVLDGAYLPIAYADESGSLCAALPDAPALDVARVNHPGIFVDN